MQQDFIFLKVPLLACYRRLLKEKEVEGAEAIIDSLMEELKTRRKCRLLTEIEKVEYLDALSIEMCIPKRIGKYADKGCFYSTLPTESKLYSSIFINVPLELTTGRDGIVDNSSFNDAVMRMLFNAENIGTAIFFSLLENLAHANRELSIIDYFVGNIRELLGVICNVCDVEETTIKEAFEVAKFFAAYKSDEMVSVSESYSVDGIVCLYLNEVQNFNNDIEEWTIANCEKIKERFLILPKSKEACGRLEDFAKAIDTTSGYFPIVDEGRNYAIEYLMDEYGYVGGDGFDE